MNSSKHALPGIFSLCVSAVLFIVPEIAAAAPAPVAIMQTTTRIPALDLPDEAVANSAVVGQLTPGLLAAASIAVTLEDGQTIVARRQRDVSEALGSKSWVGTFDYAPGSQMVLTQYRGTVTGTLQYGAAIYELVPETGGGSAHVLYRVDESRLPPMSEPVVVEGGDTLAATTDATSATGDATGIVVDLMIVYTPASRSKYGLASLESQVLGAVSGANQAYLNSNIDLSLNVVYLGEVSYTETGDMTQALSALQSTSDGKMDEVHRLRDQYGADLVMLIDEDSNWCGYAYTMKTISTSFAPYGFSVVRSGCLSNLSLPHELGHNMGSQHDRDSASNTGAYAYSYAYRRCVSDGTGFRTVMAYPCSGANRVLYFSDPYVTYNGYPTGIAYETDASTSAENARSMRNTMSTVAALRSAAGSTTTPTVPTAPGSLAAGSVSDQRIDLSWSDLSDNESGFRIERSANGVDFSEIAQVGSNVKSYADTGLSASTWYYYRLRAWNSVGASAYSNVASASTQAPASPPPAAPSSVAASTSGSDVVVTWTDMANNESGFEVEREKYNSRKGTWSSAVILTLPGSNQTSFVDSPGSGTFRYNVRSYNTGGSSSWSGPATASVAGSTPGNGQGRGRNKN